MCSCYDDSAHARINIMLHKMHSEAAATAWRTRAWVQPPSSPDPMGNYINRAYLFDFLFGDHPTTHCVVLVAAFCRQCQPLLQDPMPYPSKHFK
jgi:hypothetical protein